MGLHLLTVRARCCLAASSMALAITGLSATAAAQTSPPEDTDTRDEEVIQQARRESEIVVTGTLVRGVAPAGANVLGTSSEDIQSSGASSVAQLLQTIPQLGAFNGLQQPLGNSPEVATNRPNLRALPGANSASGSTTLVLMDGHRIVGMGVTATTPDPDVLPAGVIERLEIVPDGGSAIYGSDAVAGVMNFITIKRFDGVKVDGSYSFADDYWSWDANVTAGKDWGTGSVFVSYAYLKSDDILGRDRDYIQQYPDATTGYTELKCEPGNIEALAGAYAPRGSIVGVNGGPITQCDGSDYATLYPKSERHSVFAGLTQQLNDKMSIELRGFYTHRDTYVQNGPFRASEIIVPSFFAGTAAAMGIPAITSPFSPFVFGGIVNGTPVFVPGNANARDLIQQVTFQFGPNDASHSELGLDTWGLSSTISYDLDDNFRLRLLGNYGESTASRKQASVNEPALQNAIKAGLINPYDIGASNPDAIAIVSNFEEFGKTDQRLTNFRGIVDGDLFQMPGGAAKIAVGLEYFKEEFHSNRGQVIPGYEYSGFGPQYVGMTLVAPAQPGASRFDVSRHVNSAFGELILPVLDEAKGMGLTLSAAGRYDDYSDVGDTFNPRFGATFKPIDWISLRGAWGTSFNAPGLGDNEEADNDTLYILSGAAASAFAPPADLQQQNGGPYPTYNGGLIVAMRGNAPGIQPQEAKTYSLGADINPPFIPGMRLSATYYNIAYKNYIGLAPFENVALLYRDFPSLITLSPSQALLDEVLANADVIAQGSPPISAARTYALFDARKRNLGRYKLDGIDFSLNYQTETGFGAIFFNSSGTYELNREQQNAPGTPYVDVLSQNASRFRVRSTLGTQVGAVLGQVAWNFSEGFDLDPVVGYDPQEHVSSFNSFDLFFKVDVPGDGLTRDLSFTLNVNNVFDQDPPAYRGPNQVAGQMGTYNNYAITMGRLVKLGVSKKF